MQNPEIEQPLKLRPRPSDTVSVKIPLDTLESLREVAKSRDMSLEELLRFYIGLGLRQDLATRFGDRILETTAKVLEQHIASEEERSQILEEIMTKARSHFM
ncbi:hypothetical protein [Phormidesmis priestleyi]